MISSRHLNVVPDAVWADNENMHGNGSGGGDMTDNLEKRVEKLEDGMSTVKLDLVRLIERSEQFVTKTDLSELKGELKAEMLGLKSEISNTKSELKLDIVNVKSEFIEALDKRFDKLEDKARWKWGSVVVPVAVGILSALITFLVAKFGS
ncbi:hypothetical protein I8N75_09230 [Klebsiella quasipneumoniae]|uniref:hypothetical protein n=1 Tax=Klebsiella quasipneumoniae TaxID=1463165 RepID=UPI0018EB6E5A|nr:hypothetical protein [Klebsiella quasipneumoniae]QPV88847.1 hypothetical protein I8N75_09230 [Klebsiella quasipneumoniae]HDH1443533.1 hypothetical protein [Klebsiella quasipneumoniae subsp. similipneumoniae]HEB4940958.1 hypothetical protein [Klebsiella quasipneumoniae]